MRAIAASVLALLTSAVAGSAADGKCGLKLAVSLPMTLNEYGHPTVPVTINGTPESMIIDTGALDSTVNSRVAKELKLPRTRLLGIGSIYTFYGETINWKAEIEDFYLGRLHVGRITMLELPSAWDSAKDAGMIGPDLLRVFDLDLDFSGSKVNLFLQDHCEGRVVYWAKDWAELPLIVREDEPAHIYANATLDGVKVKALIDTGASHTHMSLETARDLFNWREDPPGLTRVDHSPDPKEARYTLTFKELNLNGVTVKNPSIFLSSNKMGNMASDLILGDDIMRQLHIYIAYKEKKAYITPAAIATGLEVPQTGK